MAKHKKHTSHKRAKAKHAEKRRFNKHVNRSLAKNRKVMHYAWEGTKRQVYNLFYKGYFDTGNALAHHHKNRKKHVTRHKSTARRKTSHRRIKTPYKTNLNKSLSFSRGLRKKVHHTTHHKSKAKRIRSPYRTNLHKILTHGTTVKAATLASTKRLKSHSKSHGKTTGKRTNRKTTYTKRTNKRTNYTKRSASKAKSNTSHKKSNGRSRKKVLSMKVMAGGTGHELGAKDTSFAAASGSSSTSLKKHKTSKKRPAKKSKAKKVTSKKRKKRNLKKRTNKKVTRKKTTRNKSIAKKNTTEEKEIAELKDQMKQLQIQNTNMQKMMQQMQQLINTMQAYRFTGMNLNNQATQQLDAQNNMPYRNMQNALTSRNYGYGNNSYGNDMNGYSDGMHNYNSGLNGYNNANGMSNYNNDLNNSNNYNSGNSLNAGDLNNSVAQTNTYNLQKAQAQAALDNHNNQLEANDLTDPALNNAGYDEPLVGNPVAGDTSHGRYYAQPALPSPNGDPNQYYFDNFEDAYREAHLNDNDSYEDGNSFAQAGRNGVIMDLNPVQQAKAIALYQQKQMPTVNQQAQIEKQEQMQKQQAVQDANALQADANSQKIIQIKQGLDRDNSQPTQPAQASQPDALESSNVNNNQQRATYSSIDVNSVDPTLAMNNQTTSPNYGLSQ